MNMSASLSQTLNQHMLSYRPMRATTSLVAAQASYCYPHECSQEEFAELVIKMHEDACPPMKGDPKLQAGLKKLVHSLGIQK
jgi:hypothetical protein